MAFPYQFPTVLGLFRKLQPYKNFKLLLIFCSLFGPTSPRTTDLGLICDETVLFVNYESCSLRLKLIGHEERNGDNITSLCNQLLLFGDL